MKMLDQAIFKAVSRALTDRPGTLLVPKTSDRSETRWRGASRIIRSLRSWLPTLGGPLSDLLLGERKTLTARSRDAYRNHPIARAVITRPRTHVVGTGLRLRANVDAKALGLTEEQAAELNDLIEREFRLWAENPRECDAGASLNFYQHQALVLVSAMLSGDCFVLTPFQRRLGCVYGLKLQTIEADRVCNPDQRFNTDTLVDGIELDPMGAAIAYHVARYHPGEKIRVGQAPQSWERVPVWGERTGRRRTLHIMNDPTERPGQVRCSPYLSPILEPLLQLEKYSRAELTAAVVAALFTVFIEKDAELFDANGATLNALSDGEDHAGLAENELALGNGAIVDLAPGEKANATNPGRPNANFDPFFASVVKQIGAALEQPFEVIMLHFSSSYSAARAAILQAWQFYRMRRSWLVAQDCQPAFELWFDEAVARRRIPVTGYSDPARRAAYTRSSWIGPKQPAIDEQKEANAAKIRIETGISNRAIETVAITGEDWDVVHAGTVAEEKARRRDGITAPANPATPIPDDRDETNDD